MISTRTVERIGRVGLALVVASVACAPDDAGRGPGSMAGSESGGGAALETERVIRIDSSIDGTLQPSRLRLPPGTTAADDPRPLVVSLHAWDGDYLEPPAELEALVVDEGWIYVVPNYRGPNVRPQACGSELAQQDILDVIDWLVDHYPVDAQRVHLTGAAGGGHMALLMAGRHPDRFASVSAWSGISDLEAFYAVHAEARYADSLRACTGGEPGQSPEVTAEYEARSARTHLAAAVGLPLDIAAGVDGGHGPDAIPVRQSLDAFNVLAQAAGAPAVSAAEIEELSAMGGSLSEPQPGDVQSDPDYERALRLRREAGAARVTLFDGGQERRPRAALAWFRAHPSR